MSSQTFNVVGWFEIPATNIKRAMSFYEAVFGYTMQHHAMGDEEMAWFPWADDGLGASGALVQHPERYQPSADGTLVYFTSPSGDLTNELAKVAAAGGKVLQEKTIITEDIGYMGLFLDTEGNRVAIHSRK